MKYRATRISHRTLEFVCYVEQRKKHADRHASRVYNQRPGKSENLPMTNSHRRTGRESTV